MIEDNTEIAIPDDFPTLTASGLADQVLAAMREAQEVTLELITHVESPSQVLYINMSGPMRWREPDIELDVFFKSQRLQDAALVVNNGKLIIVDGTSYVKGRWLETRVVRSWVFDRWVRVAPDEPRVPAELRITIDEAAAVAAPAHVMAFLAATTRLRPLGVEHLGLDDVVRYEGTVDVGELLKTVTGEHLRASLERFEAAGAADVTYELVVDRESLPREFHFMYSLDEHEVSSYVSYSLWGRSRSIMAPDEVVSWAEAVG